MIDVVQSQGRRSLSVSRRFGAILLLVLMGFTGCRSPVAVPSRAPGKFEFDTDGVSSADLAKLWVSYQIAVDSIDGATVGFSAPESCLYYRLDLRAGAHTLGVRLEYSTVIHKVRTEIPHPVVVDLDGDEAYRLIDLGSGEELERVFQPWVLPGAPASESIEIRGLAQ